jgi:hypothetical protein
MDDATPSTVFVSRLAEDVPSHFRPGHVHRAGTEFAPIRREQGNLWEIEIRVPDGEGGFWYETMVIDREKTEVVEIEDDPSRWGSGGFP